MHGLRITEKAWIAFVEREIGRHVTNTEYSKYFDGTWKSADALVAEVRGEHAQG